MEKILLFLLECFSIGSISKSVDWDGISIPVNAGSGKTWQQSNISTILITIVLQTTDLLVLPVSGYEAVLQRLVNK